MDIKFILEGKPPTKTAQQKRVTFSKGKVQFYNSAKQKQQNFALIEALTKQKTRACLEQALEVHIIFYFTKKRQKKTEPKITRPDLDNMAKALIDCLMKAEIIKDDGLIYKLTLEKYYASEERTEITIKC